MKEKVLGRGLYLLLALAVLVVSPCFAGGEEEAATAAVEEGVPQYGGALTFFTNYTHSEPTSWDQASGWSSIAWLTPFAEGLIGGDVVEHGPRGTKEFPFELLEYLPDKYFVGEIAESWEVTNDPLGVLFQIRPGNMWTGNERIGMEPREVTAYDVAYALNRNRAAPAPTSSYMTFIPEGGFEALDKYTLQVHFDQFNAEWGRCFAYGRFGRIYPKEVVDAGASDWRNQTGTGPFILKEYVKGSEAVYEKNPTWWNKEVVIDGKVYTIPFIDELVFPIIVDEATKIAALQTGKLDIAHNINMKFKDILLEKNPDLIAKEVRAGAAWDVIWMSTRGGPLADKNVRRAIAIGTDNEAVVKAIFTSGAVNGLPFNSGMGRDLWTPVGEYPPEIRVLYEYDPELAREMLAEAGYPDGFELKLDFGNDKSIPRSMAPLLKDMWKKIGLEVVLQPHESSVVSGMDSKGEFEHGVMTSWGNTKAVSGFDKLRTYPHYPFADDSFFNETTDAAMSELDADKMLAMAKELGFYVQEMAWRLDLGTPRVLASWWPGCCLCSCLNRP